MSQVAMLNLVTEMKLIYVYRFSSHCAVNVVKHKIITGPDRLGVQGTLGLHVSYLRRTNRERVTGDRRKLHGEKFSF